MLLACHAQVPGQRTDEAGWRQPPVKIQPPHRFISRLSVDRGLAETYLGAYRARLNANLRFWDSLDGKVDWPDRGNGAHPLTELLLADFLAVDLSRPYVEHGSFFEIELVGREGRSHQTCGGRSLNDDVMDTLFTLWVNGGNGPAIRDGVEQATMPAAAVFPYLAPPNPDPPPRPAP